MKKEISSDAINSSQNNYTGEWREWKFSDFVEINPTVSMKGTELYSFVEMKDLEDGNKFCFPSAERNPSSGARFNEGDTLFARITPCLENGKICKVKGLKNGIGFGSTEFLVFRGKENISDNDFVFYLSRWDEVRGYAESRFEGTSGRQRVPKNCFDNLFLNLPPLPEQQAIAEVLSSLDDKIDLLHRQNKTLEQLAETLFSEKLKVNSEKWETGKLGELFDIKIGRTPPRKEQHWFSTSQTDFKWISIKDLGNSSIYIDKASEYLTRDAVEKFNIPIIPANTVLLSFKLTVGRVAITTEDMLSNEAIAHFIIKPDTLLSPELLYIFLKSYNFNSLGSTSSIAEAINIQMIKEIEMPIPDEKNLKILSDEIKPLFQKIKSNTAQIRTLTQLRDTLLPKLMSGEVRVKNEK